MNSLIVLRLNVDLPDEATALLFKDALQARIAAFSIIKQSEAKRYWKVPETFEVNFCLQPGSDPELAYESILSSLGVGWQRRDNDISPDEQWAVWNPNDGCRFFSPYVRWASVDRFPESATSFAVSSHLPT